MPFLTSAKLLGINGIFPLASTFKAALFAAAAALDATRATYTSTNEASGAGYTTGGVTMSGRLTSASGTKGIATFNNLQWTGLTLTDFRYLELYDTTNSNRSCVVYDLGAQSISAGTLNINWPTYDSTNAMLRIA